MDIGDVNFLDWYLDIAPVTRAFLTATFAVTVLCTLDVLSPFHLYFNSQLIVSGQVRPRYGCPCVPVHVYLGCFAAVASGDELFVLWAARH
jgi:hypothetical protein